MVRVEWCPTRFGISVTLWWGPERRLWSLWPRPWPAVVEASELMGVRSDDVRRVLERRVSARKG